MGKTVSGALWLDEEKTPVYDFFQYWRNVDDADVIKCLKMMTFIPVEEIKAMESWEGAELNKAKEILAFEVTKLVHGEEKASKALEAARNIFSGGASENMPEVTLKDDDFKDGVIEFISVAVATGLYKSGSDARRTITQGGVSVNKEKVTDIHKTYTRDDFKDEFIYQSGKKKFVRVKI